MPFYRRLMFYSRTSASPVVISIHINSMTIADCMQQTWLLHCKAIYFSSSVKSAPIVPLKVSSTEWTKITFSPCYLSVISGKNLSHP